MSNLRNPFHTLYATEGINELDFPAIFSPTLIPLVLPLFQPGNVMLSGTQGTGKSMLLALLDTDIRLAFWKHEKHSFPVESAFCGYVGASINLSNSLVLKFTERDFGGEDSIACSDNECVDCIRQNRCYHKQRKDSICTRTLWPKDRFTGYVSLWHQLSKRNCSC